MAPVPGDFRYSDNEGAAYWMGIFTMAGAMQVAGLEEDTSGGKTVLFTAATGGMGIIALKLARAWGAVSISSSRSETGARPLQDPCDATGMSASSVLPSADPSTSPWRPHVDNRRPAR